MRAEVEYVAGDEDGEFTWYSRDGVSWLRVLLHLNREHRAWPWPGQYRLSKKWMRPLECDAERHVGDVAEDDDDSRDAIADAGCRCWQVEEGWMAVCESTETGARPVWETTYGSGLIPWRLRRRLRTFHPRAQHRVVLWGGRLDRRARWFDRLLLGRGHLLVFGDSWLRPWATIEREARERREQWARERAERIAAR